MKYINEANCKDRRALIRVDFNVPLDGDLNVTDDRRIREAVPTIKHILENGGSAVLMSHLGRPMKKLLPDGSIDRNRFTLRHLVNHLSELLGCPVFFVEDTDAIDLTVLGPEIETDPLFPEKINVNVASMIGEDRIKLNVWERGAGLTRACGTGACATAVAAIRKGLTNGPVSVTLPGGELEIAWDQTGHIQMTGPATEAFRGTFEWDDFA